MRPCQFFWQIFLPIFFEAHRRWDPANIFCKYLGQYFFEAHHRWGPADIFQLVTKLENPSWTKTHTDWSKFSCSFFCEYSWCGTKELLAWDNIDQFLHKIRSSTVKFFLESSEYCDKLVYEKIEEKKHFFTLDCINTRVRENASILFLSTKKELKHWNCLNLLFWTSILTLKQLPINPRRWCGLEWRDLWTKCRKKIAA